MIGCPRTTRSCPVRGQTAHAKSINVPKLQVFSIWHPACNMDSRKYRLCPLGTGFCTCVNGDEAISSYEASLASGAPFSAVIMDLTIPGGMGGKEAASRILAIDPKACLIVSSGYSNDPVMSDHRKYGFCGAVAKPYSIDSLKQQLRSICPARQKAESNC